MTMKIYKISQRENNDFDTYDAAVVAANNDDEARNILPGYSKFATAEQFGEWCSSPDKVKVECLGEAVKGIKKGVILASFRAS